MILKESERCCICGEAKPSYNNPEPLRDDMQDCCNECNRLVINARMRCCRMSKAEWETYILYLRGMTYRELLNELGTVDARKIHQEF